MSDSLTDELRTMLTNWLIVFGDGWVLGDKIGIVTEGHTRELMTRELIKYNRASREHAIVSWRITEKGLAFIKGDKNE